MTRRVVSKLNATVAFVAALSIGLPALRPTVVAAHFEKESIRNTIKLGPNPSDVRTVPSATEIAMMRKRALSLKESARPSESRLGEVLVTILDIAASSGIEKHDKIRRLPVSVVERRAADGRIGTVKSFVARGKAHFEVFVPAVPPSVLPEPEADGASSGPRESAGGDTRNVFDCYGGEPEPCATQQEMDDFMAFLAYQQSEMEYIQSEVEAGLAEIDDYCSQNPWDCEGPMSGPSDCVGPCTDYAVNAVAGAVLTTGEIIFAANHMAGAYVATGAVSSGFIAGAGLVIGGTAFLAGYAFGSFIACKWGKVRAPVVASAGPFVEPAFAS